MRISDWSSDVCSSDLGQVGMGEQDDVRLLCWRVGGDRLLTGEDDIGRGPLGSDLEHRAVDDRLRVPHRLAPCGQAAGPSGGCLGGLLAPLVPGDLRSEEHTSELQSLIRTSYAVFCL